MMMMKIFHTFTTALLLLVLSSSSNINVVQGRFHFHKNKNNPTPTPAYPPAPAAVPSDPEPTDPSSGGGDDNDDPSSSSCVFDVRDYGAIGDGITDDTPAFKAAWKDACSADAAVESSSTILIPSGSSFMITSTIFSGPCKPGLVFQVIIHFLSFFLSFTIYIYIYFLSFILNNNTTYI